MVRYVYPGSFSPPTIGHQRIVERACEIFPHVTIVCSRNAEKNTRWFNENECKEMWLSYHLPKNAVVKTFDELRNEVSGVERVVMVRGIRNENDYVSEAGVMKLNHTKYGVDTYTYFLADVSCAEISSSRVRELTSELDLYNLSLCVAPGVITRLIEKVINVKNIFMVVGKPGSGKSVFLKMLGELDPDNAIIETDKWNEEFKPLIAEHFKSNDLVKLTLEREVEVGHFLKEHWFRKLKSELITATGKRNIFVEVAYGLSPNKSLFRFLGNKVIYLGCKNETENIDRNMARNTPELIPFVGKIPGKCESEEIAKANLLEITSINTSCALEDLKLTAKKLYLWLKESAQEEAK